MRTFANSQHYVCADAKKADIIMRKCAHKTPVNIWKLKKAHKEGRFPPPACGVPCNKNSWGIARMAWLCNFLGHAERESRALERISSKRLACATFDCISAAASFARRRVASACGNVLPKFFVHWARLRAVGGYI
jgi:hypothetical protein